MRCKICGKDIDEARNGSNCNEVYQAFICQECYDKKSSNVPQGRSVNTLLGEVLHSVEEDLPIVKDKGYCKEVNEWKKVTACWGKEDGNIYVDYFLNG